MKAVFIHGSAATWRAWLQTTNALGNGWEFVLPSLLGYEDAPAPRSQGPAQIDEEVDHLLTTLGEKAPGAFHLVGHSYGGLVALRAALRVPERVVSLCLVEPVVLPALEWVGEGHRAEVIRALSDDFAAALAEGEVDRALDGFLAYWYGPGAWARFPDIAKRQLRRGADKLCGELLASARAPLPAAKCAALGIPTLLVHGSDTTHEAKRMCSALEACLPSARQAVVDGAGHDSPVRKPRVLAGLLARHFETHTPQEAP